MHYFTTASFLVFRKSLVPVLLLTLLVNPLWSQFENVPTEAWNFKVLLLTTAAGHAHSSMSNGVQLMDRLSGRCGFELVKPASASDITGNYLKDFHVVALNNTTKMQDILNAEQKKAFIDYVENFTGPDGKSQGGVFGWHGATDLELGMSGAWPWYVEFIGTAYDGSTGGDASVYFDENVPDAHPTVLGVPSQFTMSEEWYDWLQPVEENTGTIPVLWIEGSGSTRPMSWLVADRKAKTVISGIGHETRHFTDPRVENHFAGCLLYASGYDPEPIIPPVGVRHHTKNGNGAVLVNSFRVRINSELPHNMRVLDMRGRLVLMRDGPTKTSYELSQFIQPGIYLVRVHLDGKLSFLKKIILL